MSAASVVTMAEIAALIGDPARANMLAALMDGRAQTAGELAYAAHVSPSTASGHLSKLAGANLLALHRQGRHHYYRLASPLVGQMIEGLMAVAAVQVPPRHRPLSRIDLAMQRARTCYDHLAGRLAVAITDRMIERGHLLLGPDGGHITEAGGEFLLAFGIDLAGARHHHRVFCRPCLDWSERRPHLAGAIGAALCRRCIDLGWVRRLRDSRALEITPKGHAGFAAQFDVRSE